MKNLNLWNLSQYLIGMLHLDLRRTLRFVLFFRANSTCVKCKLETPIVVLHNKYPYCKECFLQNTVHKFKAVLGKNRVVHPNENVLIYHKLGHATTALLHMLRSGLNLDTPKRIKFNPIVICIERMFTLLFSALSEY